MSEFFVNIGFVVFLFFYFFYDLVIWFVIALIVSYKSYKKWKWKGLFLGLFISLFWWVPYGLYEYLYQSTKMRLLCTDDLKFKIYVSPEEWKEAVIWDKILNNYRKDFKYQDNYHLVPKEIIFNKKKYSKSYYGPNYEKRIYKYEVDKKNNEIKIYEIIYYDIFLEKVLVSYTEIRYRGWPFLFRGPFFSEMISGWVYKLNSNDICSKTFVPNLFNNYEQY